MATLEAGSRLDNIEKSINAHLNTNIATGLGLRVYYSGAGRFGDLPARWVESDTIFGSAIDNVMTHGTTAYSVMTELFLNLNFFERTDSGLSLSAIYGLLTIVDNARQIYSINSTIPVHDYATAGKPLAGGLTVWEPPDMRRIATPPEAGLRQINLSVPLRYYAVTIR